MNKKIFLLLFFIPCLVFTQEKKGTESDSVKTVIPVQAQYSDRFLLKTIDFNKKIDLGGRGEILEVAFILENLMDEPMDIYIFVIGTYEKVERTKSSLERPVPVKERLRSFVPYPEDIKNFQYPDLDTEGKQKKDDFGKDKIKLIKFPKDPKAGVDPETGKPYRLEKRLVLRTRHLSKYRANYFYFNEVVLLIFDSEGKPAFRQQFALKGKRR